jgi:hypothetical protein
MAIQRARDALSRVFYQRCFYLFVIVLALVAVVPFIETSMHARLLLAGINTFVIVAAVAAVGRTVLSFVIALLLAVPALVFHYLGLTSGDADAMVTGWMFGAALCGATILYLLRYVFQPEVMTADKLYGAAAAYLLIGVFWAYLYSLLEFHVPGSFLDRGERISNSVIDFLYVSFTVLTTTGLGDVVPITRQARSLCVVEQIVGSLFIAILIARLAGVYPPPRREKP